MSWALPFFIKFVVCVNRLEFIIENLVPKLVRARVIVTLKVRMKISTEMDPESIWDSSAQDFFLEKDTLVISMFHINPMLSRKDITVELQRVFDDLKVRLEPWIDHYVWGESPIRIQMTEHDGIEYIYGELVFGDYLDDEWLVTQILFDLSKTYEDLYIHFSDNEGEFLLVEGANHLPEWLEPDNARNRDWVNHGRILIVPEEYYKDRGLKLEEALTFLDRAVYKCTKLENLDKVVLQKLSQYPTKALEAQVCLEVTVPRHLAGILMKNNILNQAVLSYGKDSSSKQINTKQNSLVDLKIWTTALAYLFLDNYLKSQNLSSLKADGGKLVTTAVELFLEENPEIQTYYLPTDEEVQEFNERGDILQKELVRLMRIDKYVEPNISLEDMSSQNPLEQPDDEIISRLETFFKDTNAGLDGVENLDSQEQKAGASNRGIESESDSDDEDEEARSYLKQEGVDIDEDDFFEFFSKEALKLTDEDLESFRNISLENDKKEKKEKEVEEDDDYGKADEDEEEMLKHFASGNVAESLEELVKSLATEGGVSGPAATLLQSLGLNLPRTK